MATLGRGVLARFRGEASLRAALRELEALGVPMRDVVRMTGRPPAVGSGWRKRPPGGPPAAEPGVTYLLIPVSDEAAGKEVSLAMLRHSDGPVEVRDYEED
jgi:hypothetical protein